MESDPVGGLRLAFDLFEAGVRMMRQNLRRRFPAASSDEIENRLAAWIASRPGSLFGDSAGRPIASIEDPR